MTDQIRIKNLAVKTGALANLQEADPGEKFLVDAVLYTDTREAGLSDELQKSVDYGAACYFIQEYIKKHSFRLIEATAEHLAEEILMEIPQVECLDLEIKKPWPAIQTEVESVSVAINRGWHTAYLCLGSNLEEGRTYLLNAVRAVESNPMNRRVKRSEIIESQPYGSVEGRKFVNAVIGIQTLYTPLELSEYLKEMETVMKKQQSGQWGQCALDLDIVFYDDCVMSEDGLVIPHPDMQNRMFVLGPLSELCPGKLHPVFNKSVMRMRRELEKRQEKERSSK